MWTNLYKNWYDNTCNTFAIIPAKTKSNFLSLKLYVRKEYGTVRKKQYRISVLYRSLPENTVRNSVPYFFPKLNRTVIPYRTQVPGGHLRSDAHQSLIIGGGADVDHTQTIGGMQSNYWRDISPPGFGTPVSGPSLASLLDRYC